MKNLLLVLLLTGCANVGRMQAECESITKTFPDMSACLKERLSNSNISNRQDTKLYLLKADQLSEQVNKGAISDLDARIELQKLFMQLSQAQYQAAAAYAATRPRTTNCVTISNTIQCNSY